MVSGLRCQCGRGQGLGRKGREKEWREIGFKESCVAKLIKTVNVMLRSTNFILRI